MKKRVEVLIVACWLGPMAPLPAHARTQQDAANFVRGLYDRYRTGNTSSSSPTGVAAPAFFEKTLLDLIRRDQRSAHGEVGLLDHDPICDCQDAEGLTGLRVTARTLRQDVAEATAHFTISASRVTVRFSLIHTSEGWRIADIHSRDIPSLRAFLTRGSISER